MKVEELIQKLFDAEQKIIKLEAAQAEQDKQEPVVLNNMSNSWENVQAYLRQSVPKGMPEAFIALIKSPNIDEIVSRFLSWKLPTDFSPDGGISFETRYLPSSPHWVIGTNLFTADQAKAMFEYVLKGSHSELVTSPPNQAALIAELQEALEYYASMTNGGYGFRAADALAKAKGLK